MAAVYDTKQVKSPSTLSKRSLLMVHAQSCPFKPDARRCKCQMHGLQGTFVSDLPQWASVSYGTFICLSCSGQHRGLGVHISFVRSLTMDKWTDAQVAKMKQGGNAKCRAFFESSEEYNASMPIAQMYNSHFAAQYRDKLSAECEGREWDPASTPRSVTPVEATSSSSLRKPRAGIGRAPSPLQKNSDFYNESSNEPDPFANATKATVDTNYFSKLGEANASRSEHLRPSEGGKYGGFGSEGSWTPSQATSSKALPSLEDITSDPGAALSRGWGFFSSALSQASKQISESVVQPGIAAAKDPNLQAQLSSYYSSATRTLGEGARQGSSVLSHALRAGGDFAESKGLHVGDMGASYVESLAPAQSNSYNHVGNASPNDWQSHTPDQNQFFASHLNSGATPNALAAPTENNPWGSSAPPQPASRSRPITSKPKPKKDDWDSFGDDDWAKND